MTSEVNRKGAPISNELNIGRQRIWVPFAVSLFVFLLFIPALVNDFVILDDVKFIVSNKHLHSFNLDFFRWIFFNQETQWSPLRWISHAIDYRIWGLNPFGHHLTSIIFHSINTFLVIILVERLAKISLKAEGKERESRIQPLMTGVITGLLFGIHPLRVESVVWISERKDVLYGFFYLMSIICYIRYAGTGGGGAIYSDAEPRRHKRGASPLYYILSLTFFLMSVMSKSMAMTLPFIILLIDVYPLERMKSSASLKKHRLILIEKIPFFILSAFSVMVTLTIHEELGFIKPLTTPSQLTDRIIMPFKAIAFYLYKIFAPVNLAVVYPHNTEATGTMALQYSVSVILLVSITLFAVLLWKRERKIYLAIWAFFVITVFPVSGIIKIGGYFAADRYTYLASIGPLVLIAAAITVLWHKGNKKSAISSIAVISVILSIQTIRQTSVWSDPITLWTHEIRVYPGLLNAYMERGSAYSYLGDARHAVRDYDNAINAAKKKGLDRDPGAKQFLAGIYSNRGNAYVIMKNYKQAFKDYSTAIDLAPEYPMPYNNRGVLYKKLGDHASALNDFSTVASFQPEPAAYINMCGIYLETHSFIKAIDTCSKALSLGGPDVTAYKGRGIAYYFTGRYRLAIADYSHAIGLTPNDMALFRNRGNAFLKAGFRNKALLDFRRAARFGDRESKRFMNKYPLRE